MIRPLKWKNKFLTGQSEIDQRLQSLVDLFNQSLLESNQVEHCQDINELYQSLLTSIETLLAQVQTPHVQLDEQHIREILTTEFPLPAREKAACRHCGRCDRLEQRLKEWLTSSS